MKRPNLRQALDAAYGHATAVSFDHVARDPLRFPTAYLNAAGPNANANAEIAA